MNFVGFMTIWFPPAEKIVGRIRIRIIWDTWTPSAHFNRHIWILNDRMDLYDIVLHMFFSSRFCVRLARKQTIQCQPTTRDTCSYSKFIWRQSALVIVIPGMFTHVFLCLSVSALSYNTLGVRRSLFSSVDRVCKWKHHTLPKCLRLNAGVWKTLFVWPSPGCAAEKENTLLTVTLCLPSP